MNKYENIIWQGKISLSVKYTLWPMTRSRKSRSQYGGGFSFLEEVATGDRRKCRVRKASTRLKYVGTSSAYRRRARRKEQRRTEIESECRKPTRSQTAREKKRKREKREERGEREREAEREREQQEKRSDSSRQTRLANRPPHSIFLDTYHTVHSPTHTQLSRMHSHIYTNVYRNGKLLLSLSLSLPSPLSFSLFFFYKYSDNKLTRRDAYMQSGASATT